MHYYDTGGYNVLWSARKSLTMSRIYIHPHNTYFSTVPHKILAP